MFRALVVPNCARVTPAEWESAQVPVPVVAADVHGSASAAAIFGATKIKGGTRLGSWTADAMQARVIQ